MQFTGSRRRVLDLYSVTTICLECYCNQLVTIWTFMSASRLPRFSWSEYFCNLYLGQVLDVD
jgi:hypothetical protein